MIIKSLHEYIDSGYSHSPLGTDRFRVDTNPPRMVLLSKDMLHRLSGSPNPDCLYPLTSSYTLLPRPENESTK